MRTRLWTSLVVAATVLAAGPASASGTIKLDGSTRMSHPIEGQLAGVPGAVPLVGIEGVTDEACDPGNCDETELVLSLPVNARQGNLLVRVSSAVDNAGVGLRLLDATGRVVSRGDGSALGAGADSGLTAHQGAFISLPRLEAGSYTLRVVAYGGAASFEGVVQWRAR